MIIFRLNSSEGAVVFLDIHGNEETKQDGTVRSLHFNLYSKTPVIYTV